MGISSLVQKAKNTATKMKQSFTKNKDLRKYVWYDYSIVEKAKIQLITSTQPVDSFVPGASGTEDYLNFDSEVPVQINPSEFRYEHSLDPQSITNRLASAPWRARYTLGDHPQNQFSQTVIFDIYDEYNARTANGSIPTDFSLMNTTALPFLIKFAGESGDKMHLVRFMWGSVVKFGILVDVSVDYTAFSQWGQPLKATAALNIMEIPTANEGGPSRLRINGEPGFSSIKKAAKRVATLKNIFR